MQENKEEIFKDVAVKEVEPPPRAQPLLYVLTVLIMANLVITAWLAMRPSGRTVGDTKSLPSSLTKTERTRLFESFQSPYNAEDYNALYQIFDPVAQVQISRPEFEQSVENMRTVLGRVENGVYSYHEYIGNQQGREWFHLHYVVKFEKAAEEVGYLKLTIASAGREFGIWKFDLGY